MRSACAAAAERPRHVGHGDPVALGDGGGVSLGDRDAGGVGKLVQIAGRHRVRATCRQVDRGRTADRRRGAHALGVVDLGGQRVGDGVLGHHDEVRGGQLVQLGDDRGLDRLARHGHQRHEEQPDDQRIGRRRGATRIAHRVVRGQTAGQPEHPQQRADEHREDACEQRSADEHADEQRQCARRQQVPLRADCLVQHQEDRCADQEAGAEHRTHLGRAGGVDGGGPHRLHRLRPPRPERRDDDGQDRDDRAGEEAHRDGPERDLDPRAREHDVEPPKHDLHEQSEERADHHADRTRTEPDPGTLDDQRAAHLRRCAADGTDQGEFPEPLGDHHREGVEDDECGDEQRQVREALEHWSQEADERGGLLRRRLHELLAGPDVDSARHRLRQTSSDRRRVALGAHQDLLVSGATRQDVHCGLVRERHRSAVVDRIGPAEARDAHDLGIDRAGRRLDRDLVTDGGLGFVGQPRVEHHLAVTGGRNTLDQVQRIQLVVRDPVASLRPQVRAGAVGSLHHGVRRDLAGGGSHALGGADLVQQRGRHGLDETHVVAADAGQESEVDLCVLLLDRAGQAGLHGVGQHQTGSQEADADDHGECGGDQSGQVRPEALECISEHRRSAAQQSHAVQDRVPRGRHQLVDDPAVCQEQHATGV